LSNILRIALKANILTLKGHVTLKTDYSSFMQVAATTF